MSASRRRGPRKPLRTSPGSELHRYFPVTRSSSARAGKDWTRAAPPALMASAPSSPLVPSLLDLGSPLPTPVGPSLNSPSSSLPPGDMSDLRALIQALPSKRDFEALALRLEEAHARDIQAVRSDVQVLTDRVTEGESSVQSLEARVALLETARAAQDLHVTELELRLVEMEDRSRRNNLRLRGIPEATDQESLLPTVQAICHRLAPDIPPASLEFDRVHRALGPRSSDAERPRDVVCRLHRYTHKDMIVRQAWEAGEIDFDGAKVRILPDLSRATLQRRALLRPLLDRIRQLGCTYRWGFPFALTVRKGPSSVTVRHPDDLPALFSFLEVPPMDVPNWLQQLQTPGRRGPPTPGRERGLPPRTPRRRRRLVPEPSTAVRED